MPLHTEFLPYLEVLTAASHRELIQSRRVGDFHLRVVEMAHVGGIYSRRNPAFPEVEIKVFKGNVRRFCIFQCLQRLFDLRHTLIFGIAINPSLYALRFLYHVPSDEAVFDLVTGHEGIIVDASLQGCEQFLFRAVGYLTHIVEIDRAELVERCGQGFFGCADIGMALHREGNGTLEDVRLDELSVLRPFQREDVTSACVHHHQLHILLGVEVAVAHDELIVTGVQMLTPRYIFLVPVRFIAVQTLVGITERHIQQRLLLLVAFQVKRLECRAVRCDVFQVADGTARPVSHQRPFTQVHFRCAVVGTG